MKGCCVTDCDTITEWEKQKIDEALAALSKTFYETLAKPAYPAPTQLKLWGFKMGRTSIRLMLDNSNRDHRYYKEKGWFESDYYYPTRLGALKKAAGSLSDVMATRSVRRKES